MAINNLQQQQQQNKDEMLKQFQLLWLLEFN